MIRAAILGATGYTACELLGLLLRQLLRHLLLLILALGHGLLH